MIQHKDVCLCKFRYKIAFAFTSKITSKNKTFRSGSGLCFLYSTKRSSFRSFRLDSIEYSIPVGYFCSLSCVTKCSFTSHVGLDHCIGSIHQIMLMKSRASEKTVFTYIFSENRKSEDVKTFLFVVFIDVFSDSLGPLVL